MDFPKLFPEHEGLDESIRWQIRGLDKRNLVVVVSVFTPRFPAPLNRPQGTQLDYALYVVSRGVVTGQRLVHGVSGEAVETFADIVERARRAI